jgi:hypothetical protein
MGDAREAEAEARPLLWAVGSRGSVGGGAAASLWKGKIPRVGLRGPTWFASPFEALRTAGSLRPAAWTLALALFGEGAERGAAGVVRAGIGDEPEAAVLRAARVVAVDTTPVAESAKSTQSTSVNLQEYSLNA